MEKGPEWLRKTKSYDQKKAMKDTGMRANKQPTMIEIKTCFQTTCLKQLMTFHVNQEGFRRSWKRRFVAPLIGRSIFGEWFCGGILVEARKG